MQDYLFYLFALLTLGCGSMIVLSRNPINSAMFLVLAIASMAGLFVLLHAFFLAAVQVLVYAGAVMVLFLFVIMLLDLKVEQRRRMNTLGIIMGFVSVGTIIAVMLRGVLATPVTPVLEVARHDGATEPLGQLLFSHYVLPFEILSVLLLVAMVGVILLSKKELK